MDNKLGYGTMDATVVAWQSHCLHIATQHAFLSLLSDAGCFCAEQVVERLAYVGAAPWGGYSQAERCRLLVGAFS